MKTTTLNLCFHPIQTKATTTRKLITSGLVKFELLIINASSSGVLYRPLILICNN